MQNSIAYSRGPSFGIVVIAYVICLIIGYYSLEIGRSYFSPLLNMFVADVVATFVIWFFSIALRNASMYDAYWSVIPMAVFYFWVKDSAAGLDLKNELILIAVAYWGIRLTVNWARGWTGLVHQDWRYKMLEDKNPSLYWLTNLGGIHLFPTVVVFLCMIPAYYAITATDTANTEFIIGGFLVSIFGTTIEFVADEQMKRFKKTAKPKEYIDFGLWKYSRHPNYFGEISFWAGILIMALGVSASLWWTGIGLVVIVSMFMFASIPMMEERTLRSRPEYATQIKRVSVLVPWFRKQL
jgi:steroid 5-alpha reductase family enzyme